MVPFALGTQTMGSVLRPASYCGVTGFKASYGVLSLDGVLPFASSLDTLGFFTHTPVDMLALWEAMGRAGGVAEEFDLAVPDSVPGVEPSMAAAFQSAVATLRRGGMSIRSIDIAGMLTELHPAALDVEFYEGARFHEQRFKGLFTQLGVKGAGQFIIRDLEVKHGPQQRQARKQCRVDLSELLLQ
jgi:Asp-tRNA(Asn)/Glu-tRNA(Gln) amidotransferase A subunit family amidase